MTDGTKKTMGRPLQIALGAIAVVLGLLMMADGLKTLFGAG